MKKPLISLMTIAMVCLLASMAAIDAYAEGGKARVEAAKAKGLPVFVDFGKTSCKPCKMMVPVLDSLTKKYKGTLEVVFVHVDEEKEYAMKMGATMIPTQVLIDKDGKEVSRHVGYIPVEDCEKMIGNIAAPAQPDPKAGPKKAAKAKSGSCGNTCSTGSVCK